MATKTKKATVVAKKVNATRPAPKKAAVVKKIATKKVVASKKPVAKKAIAKKPTPVKKATIVKKAAVKPGKVQKKPNTIKKPSPVKKAAKAGVKKAVPKKLAIPKKSTVKKTTTASKKELATPKKVVPVNKNVTPKPVKITPVAKVTTDHQADLKKALAKVKAKKKEEEKKPMKPFVMPKTNTEKARKYEPEFTKSVLDQSPPENSGPTMRYSDGELTEFRELITRKLETAKKELGYLQGLITRKDQMGGDESDNRYMTMEDGSLSMEREQLSQMASRQITFIDHLEKAMMRIENKTYGICRVTGKLIDKARLRAVPHATLSIEAKMGIAK
ncbi:MAG: TraR/DksA C4-type zinc finger protein [Ginsengibacter sp.]